VSFVAIVFFRIFPILQLSMMFFVYSRHFAADGSYFHMLVSCILTVLSTERFLLCSV